MSELKPCPFCGGKNELKQERGYVDVCCALIGSTISIDEWNTRPIEDALQAEIDRLQEKLHDELSQLEIATDLGNKRWLALNDIYKDGEKHNVDWCKRKAQEGLGIK